MRLTTFSAALSELQRTDASRPLVTFYDDATGERVELSVATYSNWVSKTAGLVQDELDVEPGSLVLVDLPTHWLGAVWLGAAWSLGLCVTPDPSRATAAGLVVCGPDGVEEYAAAAAGRPVVALSLRPLGGRFVDPLPEGITDYGAVVLAQPDVLTAYRPPAAEDPAWSGAGQTLSQQQMLERSADDPVVEPGGRLLTDVNPCSDDGWRTLLAPLVRQAGVVWVANPDADRWQQRAEEERTTARLTAQLPRS